MATLGALEIYRLSPHRDHPRAPCLDKPKTPNPRAKGFRCWPSFFSPAQILGKTPKTRNLNPQEALQECLSRRRIEAPVSHSRSHHPLLLQWPRPSAPQFKCLAHTKVSGTLLLLPPPRAEVAEVAAAAVLGW